jgi:epoxide hydrolase-like predicted phosphatase
LIKTIFFDFGGVIIKPPNYKWINRWKKQLGISAHPEIMEMLENPNGSKLVQDVCLGKIQEDHLWAVMTETWRINPVLLGQIRRKLLSKRQLNQHILAFMNEVAKTYTTAILSNAGDKSRQLMEETYQLHQIVDEIIISAEEGVIKPDPRMFEIAMTRMDAAPETSLLLDDSQENVAAAQDFGMRAVQFIDTQQAIGEMRVVLNGKV